MYFIELLVKYFQKDKVENLLEKYEKEKARNPLDETFALQDESENCEHIFSPIDSTETMFACRKCGLLIDKKTYDSRNFFKDK